MQLESQCTRCHETFVPHSLAPEEQVHGETEAGTPCGGLGVIMRIYMELSEQYPDIHHLQKLEHHGRDYPDCSDPDCEFHHPEVRETA